jgi:hypothetical protein
VREEKERQGISRQVRCYDDDNDGVDDDNEMVLLELVRG